MQPFLDIFSAVAAARADDFRVRHGLVIKWGEGMGAVILKLLKPEWTTDAPEQLINTNGLFFSIWVDAASASRRHARYNLHARKLRNLKGAAFAAREFARVFRTHAGPTLQDWPSITFPKGPITLFEGHVRLDVKTLAAETSVLMDRFVTLVPVIDVMLAAAPTSGMRPMRM